MRLMTAIVVVLLFVGGCAHQPTTQEILEQYNCDSPLVTCKVTVRKPEKVYPRTVQQARRHREIRDFLANNRARRQSEREHRIIRNHHH